MTTFIIILIVLTCIMFLFYVKGAAIYMFDKLWGLVHDYRLRRAAGRERRRLMKLMPPLSGFYIERDDRQGLAPAEIVCDKIFIVPGQVDDLHESGWLNMSIICVIENVDKTEVGARLVGKDSIELVGTKFCMDCNPKNGWLCLWSDGRLVVDSQMSTVKIREVGADGK